MLPFLESAQIAAVGAGVCVCAECVQAMIHFDGLVPSYTNAT